MPETKPFRLAARAQSFRHAFAGLYLLLRTQHNAWIHLAATALVVIAGFFAGLAAAEWTALILSAALVWTAEALNTAFEFLCDAVSPEFHKSVEAAKDVAAGAVLISAIGAVVVGAFVFLPHL